MFNFVFTALSRIGRSVLSTARGRRLFLRLHAVSVCLCVLSACLAPCLGDGAHRRAELWRDLLQPLS